MLVQPADRRRKGRPFTAADDDVATFPLSVRPLVLELRRAIRRSFGTLASFHEVYASFSGALSKKEVSRQLRDGIRFPNGPSGHLVQRIIDLCAPERSGEFVDFRTRAGVDQDNSMSSMRRGQGWRGADDVDARRDEDIRSVMFGLEGPVARAIERVGLKLLGTATRPANEGLRQDARTLVPGQLAQRLLMRLNETEVLGLTAYLASPDFEEITLQYVLYRVLWDVPKDLTVNIRGEVLHGLRHSAGLRKELLVTAADVVLGALVIAFNEFIGAPARGDLRNPKLVAVAAEVSASAAANCRLLSDLGDLVGFHEFARQLRAQVAAVHGQMRLPHLGVSRSVPYDQLYVEPLLHFEQDEMSAPGLAELPLPGQRSVILGDPGAGKSTLATKLAHDVASDRVPGAEGRAPFLLLLRNFAESFRTGGKGLVYYLEQVCADPYNLDPPARAVEYLLLNGRAVVLLDGLDELVEPELRRKVVQLVDGFVNLYPLVPVVVTARRIGYSDAPLDRRLFASGVIAHLNEDRVRTYAQRWFALDESAPETDRARMASSFLAESSGIGELRSNPLLLALLCAMYSSEHFIPQNLPQVYEQCAVMLFNRWDSMRGIPMPLQFRGRLRGAVQYLSWRLFNSEEPSKALPQHRLVRILADYLVAKHFDEDEAIALGEQFLEFCTGRSWVLTDVGATASEPRYGFTHRTFLEYFAAEHLVRTRRTANLLWQELRPHVLDSAWEVVTQIALQLLDRNVDGGVDEFLRLVMSETPTDLHERARLHGLAARTLGYVHPGQDLVTEIVAIALADALEGDVLDRVHYWAGTKTRENLRLRGEALRAAVQSASPGNLPVVRSVLTQLLGDRIESGHEMAWLVALTMSTHLGIEDQQTVTLWKEVCRDLHVRHADPLATWNTSAPYISTHARTEPERFVEKWGPRKLYLAHTSLSGPLPSIAEQLLRSSLSPGRNISNIARLCELLIAAERPWIPDLRWWTEFARLDPRDRPKNLAVIEAIPWHKVQLDPAVLLCLPYLETAASIRFSSTQFRSFPLPLRLIYARAQGDAYPALLQSLRDHDIAEDTRVFLTSWARREFDVLCPRPHDP